MKYCTIDGCGKKLQCKSLCSMHRYRVDKFGSPDLPAKEFPNTLCLEDGCNKFKLTKGRCNKHYLREKKLRLYNKQTHHSKHGLHNTTEFHSWAGAKNRCLNPNNPKYSGYGGRGITVCDRWLDKPNGFLNFLEDMGKKPSAACTLNRIDNDGNYEPSNCEWANIHTQAANKRNNNKTVGVYYYPYTRGKNKWSAKLFVANKLVLNGRYPTEAEAIAARKDAELKYLYKQTA